MARVILSTQVWLWHVSNVYGNLPWDHFDDCGLNIARVSSLVDRIRLYGDIAKFCSAKPHPTSPLRYYALASAPKKHPVHFLGVDVVTSHYVSHNASNLSDLDISNLSHAVKESVSSHF